MDSEREEKDEDKPEQDRKMDITASASNYAVTLKSTAVVKYCNQELPACFQRLHKNTDLNAPPSNWLSGNSRWETYIRQSTAQGRPKGDPLYSFKRAHLYPDLAGEVDVITDAENIKRLLKIPYNNANVSMLVHRVDNTLLLDEFDIHQQLLRREKDEWQWLRKFYYDTVLQDMRTDKCVIKKNKSRHNLQSRDMFSKFLYYSLNDDVVEAPPGNTAAAPEKPPISHVPTMGSSTAQAMLIPDPLPMPEVEAPEQHQRTVLWTFEDLRMLVGTDLPIFGGGSHPAVSLALRDMHKPINVLTGLDYWLDNLMCNVPELAMCYHLNGIVQNYELIKTEEIPNLEQSKFKPQVVKDIAQNILSFLKSNATQEGHTYWLFKGQNDDIVKLYDLTSVCEEYMEESSTNSNPFSIPVGILLYRVARNLRQTTGRKKSATIRTLLQNCLKLLDKERHSQIASQNPSSLDAVVTSAHYLLCDLYVSDDLEDNSDPSTSTATSSDDTDEEEADDNESEAEEQPKEMYDTEENVESSVAVKSLCLPETHRQSRPASLDVVRYPPIVGSKADRSVTAVTHIAQGLQCLDHNILAYDTSKHRVDEQMKCNPSEAIPLHYEPLKSPKKTLNPKPNTNQSESRNILAPQNPKPNTNQSESRDIVAPQSPKPRSRSTSISQELHKSASTSKGSWHTLSKTLLLRKAAVVYFHLSNNAVASAKCDQALSHLRIGLLCYCAMKNLSPSKESESQDLLCALLTLIADVRLLLAKQQQQQQHQHQQQHDSQLEKQQQQQQQQVEQQQIEKQQTQQQKEQQQQGEEGNVEMTSDDIITESAQKEITAFEYENLCLASMSNTDNFAASVRAYLEAETLAKGKQGNRKQVDYVRKRLGNAHNEYGVALMNQAAVLLSTDEDSPPPEPSSCAAQLHNIDVILKGSGEAFLAGVQCFQALEDRVNQAMLYSNLGRLMRLCAKTQRDLNVTSAEITPTEKQYFLKAAEHYKNALSCVNDKDHSTLYGSISWELSSAYFGLATLLQDFAPLSTTAQEQVEKEVTELMTKALKYCHTASCSARQYRAATIHHRLASLYHNSYRNQGAEQKKKQLRSLAELHYGKAMDLFVAVDSPCEMMRVQLERVAMCEYHLQGQTSAISKVRTLQQALQHLLQCSQPVRSLITQLEEDEEDEGTASYSEETIKLLAILQSRLQATLHALVKNTAAAKKSTNENQWSDTYKQLYGQTLKLFQNETPVLKDKCYNMEKVLQSLKQTLAKTEKS